MRKSIVLTLYQPANRGITKSCRRACSPRCACSSSRNTFWCNCSRTACNFGDNDGRVRRSSCAMTAQKNQAGVWILKATKYTIKMMYHFLVFVTERHIFLGNAHFLYIHLWMLQEVVSRVHRKYLMNWRWVSARNNNGDTQYTEQPFIVHFP